MKSQPEILTQSPDPWYGEPDFKLPRPTHPSATLDKGWREARFHVLQSQLYRGRSGLEVSLEMTEATDQSVIQVLNKEMRFLRRQMPFAVVALGGYGSGQIAPYSDVELRIVSCRSPEEFEKAFPGLPALHDRLMALGLRWDHGVHHVHFPMTLRPGFDGAEHAKGTKVHWVETMTSLLSARLLFGEPQIFLEYEAAIQGMVRTHHREILAAMRDGRTELIEQFGEHDTTPHHLKKSGGGLRDSNFIDWEVKIGSILGKRVLSDDELGEFKELHGRQLAVKQVLHMAYDGTKRLDEKRLYTLTDEKIRLLPFKLGSADPVRDAPQILDHAERVYFETAQRISHLADKVHRRGNWIFGFAGPAAHQTEADRLGAEISEKRARNAPEEEIVSLVLKAYRGWQQQILPGEAGSTQLRRTTSWTSLLDSLDPLAKEIEHSAYRHAQVSAAFHDLLCDVGRTAPVLERLSRAGFLAQLAPSVGATRHVPMSSGAAGQTIDGHTFEALGCLDRVFFDSALQTRLGVREDLQTLSSESRAEMVFALLEHDTGLIRGRAKSHAEIGQSLAVRDARSLGFSDLAAERIGAMVLNHSYLSRTSQSAGITRKSIRAASARIPEEKVLLSTFLVDWADNASSPPFTGTKEDKLISLYARTRDRLIKGERFMEALAVSAEGILAESNALRNPTIPPIVSEDLIAHLKSLPEDYSLSTNTKTIAAHLALAKEIEHRRATGSVDTTPLFRWLPGSEDRTRVFVFVAPDEPGIFARITGALADNRLNIEDARIATRKDIAVACDTFTIPFSFDIEETYLGRVQRGIVSAYNRTDLVEKLWERRPAMKGGGGLPDRGPQRGKVIQLENDPSSDGTKITVRGSGDYPGLAAVFGYAISRELGCSIIHADLGGGGQRITNHFLVVNSENQPIPAADFERVEKVLLAAMFKS